MADIRDIVAFSCDGEKILGVVIDHYTNPLDDIYVVYAGYALYKFHDSNEDAKIVIENVIIPACDEALADFRLKRQHLRDIKKYHSEIGTLLDTDISKIVDETTAD